MTIEALNEYRARVIETSVLSKRLESLSSEINEAEREYLREELKENMLALEADRNHIDDWLGTLPVQDRPLMLIYYCLGLSWPETAKISKKTERLVYYANRRMLEALNV